ncbi:MAG: EVE domain-containing protein, partial [Acidobacteriota bacterium]
LFYHSNRDRAVVGIARVVRPAYPDPTAGDPRWVAVDVVPEQPLRRPVPLSALRHDPRTRAMPLVRQSRLSVSPVTPAELDAVLELAGG